MENNKQENLLKLVDAVSNFIGEIFKETLDEVGKDIAKEKPAIKAAVKNNVRKPIYQFLDMILRGKIENNQQQVPAETANQQ